MGYALFRLIDFSLDNIKKYKMADIKAIAEQLVSLTVKEAKELADILKEEYGIEPAATQVAVGAIAAEAAAVAEEKTEFNVQLKEVGSSKLKVVKKLREITGLSLGEAKALVDDAPSMIKEGIPKDEANTIKSQLEEEGAVVELQ